MDFWSDDDPAIRHLNTPGLQNSITPYLPQPESLERRHHSNPEPIIVGLQVSGVFSAEPQISSQ